MLWILLMACGGDVQQAPQSGSSLFDVEAVELPPGEPAPMPRGEEARVERVESPDCRAARARFERMEKQVVTFRNGTMGPVSDAVDRAQEALDGCVMDTERCGLKTVKHKEALAQAQSRYDAALARLGQEEIRLHPLQEEVLSVCN